MSEVYLARDTQLDRDIALKIFTAVVLIWIGQLTKCP